MKLVEMKCKNCGSILQIEENVSKIRCCYCQSEYVLDDEVQHIKYDDMEQAGYEFEKGKIKAQKEAQQEKSRIENEKITEQILEEKRKKNRKWLILCWIFLLPFMLTYTIIKSNKLTTKAKIIILIIIWILFLLIGYGNSFHEDDDNKNYLNTENRVLEKL